MKSISIFLQKGAFSSNRIYRNPLSLIFFTLFLTGFLTLPGSNVKADGGSWTSPNWSAFNITGASGCNSTSLSVTWNQWSFFCCGGFSNTYQYKATIELEYSANGTSGWSTVQTIVKNGSPFSQSFTISATGYYRAWVKQKF